MTASDHGFVLNPRMRPEFLSPYAGEFRAGVDDYYVPRAQAIPAVPLVPATHPGPASPRERYAPRDRYEGFASGPGPSSPGLRQEIEHIRGELLWLRQERYDLQRRMDVLCFLMAGFAVLWVVDAVRRWNLPLPQ